MAGILTSAASIRFPSLSLPSTSHSRTSTRISASAAVTAAPRNPYEVLRVKQTATAAEIKSAYRSLAKRFHPDAVSAGGDRREEVFVEIHDAYSMLSDPDARSRYDASIRRPVVFRRGGSVEVRTRRWETDQCW